jgi:hypothetical protein
MFWASGFWASGFWADGFWEGMTSGVQNNRRRIVLSAILRRRGRR